MRARRRLYSVNCQFGPIKTLTFQLNVWAIDSDDAFCQCRNSGYVPVSIN